MVAWQQHPGSAERFQGNFETTQGFIADRNIVEAIPGREDRINVALTGKNGDLLQCFKARVAQNNRNL